MSKLQTAESKRLEDIRSKWRTDSGDYQMIEQFLDSGRTDAGYTDSMSGKLARIFDLKGRLSIAQVSNVRRVLLERVNLNTLEAPKAKRQYTRKTIG